VWCTKCTHYFCWICKRPGNLCSSYSCRGSKNKSSVLNDIIGGKAYKITSQIQQFKALTIAEEQYHSTLKRGALLYNKDIALQVQLTHIIVWARAYLAIHPGNTKWRCVKLKNAVKSLEQILNVISMKNNRNLEMMSSLFEKGCLNIMDDFCAKESVKQESLRKGLTTRKIQALNQIDQRRVENNSSAQLQSPKLSFSDFISFSKLCIMNERRFKANAAYEMFGTIEQLNQEYTRQTRIASEKYADALIKSGSNMNLRQLNQKAKPLIASWKNKLSQSASDKYRINRLTSMEGNKIDSAVKGRKRRWKGKHRVKVRRRIALTQSN